MIILYEKKMTFFLIFPQNINCGLIHVRIEAVLTSARNLCFRAKVRKIMYTM